MLENAKEALRARIAPTSSHLAALRGDLRKRLQHFKAHREAAEQSALEHDFAQVLRAWGIEDAAHIPVVLRELRLRLLVFALPVLVCAVAVLFSRSNAAWLTLMLIALPCGFGMLTTCWRLSVLSRCRFLSFTRWLCSLVGLAQKGA